MLESQTVSSIATTAQDRIVIATVGFLLGTFLLFGVGFAQSEVLHNAAHDTRHAMIFPCH